MCEQWCGWHAPHPTHNGLPPWYPGPVMHYVCCTCSLLMSSHFSKGSDHPPVCSSCQRVTGVKETAQKYPQDVSLLTRHAQVLEGSKNIVFFCSVVSCSFVESSWHEDWTFWGTHLSFHCGLKPVECQSVCSSFFLSFSQQWQVGVSNDTLGVLPLYLQANCKVFTQWVGRTCGSRDQRGNDDVISVESLNWISITSYSDSRKHLCLVVDNHQLGLFTQAGWHQNFWGARQNFDARASNLSWHRMESINKMVRSVPGLTSKFWHCVICVKTIIVLLCTPRTWSACWEECRLKCENCKKCFVFRFRNIVS